MMRMGDGIYGEWGDLFLKRKKKGRKCRSSFGVFVCFPLVRLFCFIFSFQRVLLRNLKNETVGFKRWLDAFERCDACGARLDRLD